MNFFNIVIFLVFITYSLIAHGICTLGEFQPVSNSPFIAGINPVGVAYSPIVLGNLFSAVVNFNDNTVSVYSVDQETGVFTQVTGSPFSTGPLPIGIAFSPVASGNLFAAIPNNNNSTVSVYSVNQTTGVFTTVGTFGTGTLPQAIAFSPIASGNLFAAVVNDSDNTVSVYMVNQTTGAFTQVPGSPFVTGLAPQTVAFSPVVSGNLFAAVTNNNDSTVSVYSVDQITGVFTTVGTFGTGRFPQGVAFSPVVSGNLFAAVANGTDNTVSVYMVNQTTGSFISAGTFSTNEVAFGVAFSPVVLGNLFAAVTNLLSDDVSVYYVVPETGLFILVDVVATGVNPEGVAFSPLVSDNVFAAVANRSSNNVSVYNVCVSNILPLLRFNDCIAHTVTGTAQADGFNSMGTALQITGCLAYDCESNGFNHDATSIASLESCQAAYNGAGFLVASLNSLIGNCIAFANKSVGFDVTPATSIYYCFASQNGVNNYVNAMNIQNTDTQIDNTVSGLTGPFAGANLFM